MTFFKTFGSDAPAAEAESPRPSSSRYKNVRRAFLSENTASLDPWVDQHKRLKSLLDGRRAEELSSRDFEKFWKALHTHRWETLLEFPKFADSQGRWKPRYGSSMECVQKKLMVHPEMVQQLLSSSTVQNVLDENSPLSVFLRECEQEATHPLSQDEFLVMRANLMTLVKPDKPHRLDRGRNPHAQSKNPSLLQNATNAGPVETTPAP